jgi:predicted O-methyltransferase YrrM
VIKKFIPQTVRNRLNAEHYRFVFKRAVKEFMLDPEKWSYSGSPVVRDLIWGWHNEGWSVNDEYLVACIHHALHTDGPILECGSGLSTIVLGLVARSREVPMWSLEHIPEWADRVGRNLKRFHIDSVRLCVRPLKVFPEFSWYDAPLNSMPEFSLIICDGPPAETRGGRYGLLPVMRSKLKPGAMILLDDTLRDHERAVAGRWAAELKTDHSIHGVESTYALLKVPT